MTPAAAPWRAGQKILILIPHPDDEVVGCHAAVRRAQSAGARIFGLMLTTGVPAREVLWPWQRHGHAARVQQRREEARAATRALDYTEVRFRDLPTRRLRLDLPQARQEIVDLISAWGIDTLWTPAYEGGHADHDSTNVLAASLRGNVSEVFEFAEYNYRQNRIHSQSFPSPNGSEFVLSLTPEEQAAKQQALSGYVSAQRDLNYVDVKLESLRPMAVYDYRRPPHPGTLFYQRFHWVPFRHPAIDFTRPEEACTDFGRFWNEIDHTMPPPD